MARSKITKVKEHRRGKPGRRKGTVKIKAHCRSKPSK